jgi:hypothetical protein
MAKGRKGKPGPSSVNPSSKGGKPVNTTGGAPGHSPAQKPIPGPGSRKASAMAAALTPKFIGGSDATGAAGIVR